MMTRALRLEKVLDGNMLPIYIEMPWRTLQPVGKGHVSKVESGLRWYFHWKIWSRISL